MAITNQPIERRKDKRFDARDQSFVFFDSKPAIAGKIVDISVGGLGFTYLASEQRTGDFLRFQMLCISCNYNSMVIPAKTISDFEMFETVVGGERRSGAQFETLTQEQKHDLEAFIKCCTLGSA